MITVKVELWPGGLKDHAMEIGRAYIHNVSNLAPRSNYRGVVCRRGVYEPPLTAMKRATRQISVEGYPRKHLNVWCLITRALLSAFPEERPRTPPEQGELLERVASALGLPQGSSEADVLSEIALLRSGERAREDKPEVKNPAHGHEVVLLEAQRKVASGHGKTKPRRRGHSDPAPPVERGEVGSLAHKEHESDEKDGGTHTS